jgi:hypothetical protein
LGGEILLLGDEDLEHARVAAVKADDREFGGVFIGLGLLFDLHSIETRLVIPDEAVGDVAEGFLDGLLVFELGLVALSPGEVIGAGDGSSGIEGLGELAGERPDGCRALEEAGDRSAGCAELSGERDLGEIGGLGDTDVGIRGNEALLAGENIGAALQQGRGKAGGDLGLMGLIDEREAAIDRAGVSAEQDADLVFGLGDGLVAGDDLGLCLLEEHLGLVDVGDGGVSTLELDGVKSEDVLVGGDGLLRDVQLKVKVAKLVVGGRDA